MKLIRLLTILSILAVAHISFAIPATPVIPNVKLLVPVPIDCTSAPQTFNLTANNTAVSFVKTDATANHATLSPAGGYTIMGQATYTLYLKNETVLLILVGTDWKRF